MTAESHLVDLQTQFKDDGSVRYRWRCTCGDFAKRWCNAGPGGRGAGSAAARARAGGEAHAGRHDGRVEWSL